MLPFLSFLIALSRLSTLDALEDLDTAAITVYRNPEFFKHLSDEFNNHIHQFSKDPYNYGPKDQYKSPVDGENFFHHLNEQYEKTFPNEREHQETDESEVNNDEYQEEDENYSEIPQNHRERYRGDELEDEHDNEDQQEELEESDDYKYPGEPKKPNPPIRPSVNVHFDGSPDFGHPNRNLPSPKSPKKKGRGPYGHPKFEESEYPKYSEEYEDDRKKSEEEQLAEIEEESRRENEQQGLPPPKKYYKEYSRTSPYNNDEQRHVNNPVPLKVYHQGQRFPVEPEEYIGDEDVHYPLQSHGKGLEKFNSDDEIRDTKKGTREYLRHAKLPSHHELHDSESQKQKKAKKAVKVSCNTQIVPKKKKKNTYISYSVRPIYSRYRVVPYSPKTVRTIYYVKPGKSHYRRRSIAAPKLVDDDSAYIINSELDSDYQRLEVIREKKIKN